MSEVVLVLAHAADTGAASVAASLHSMLREDAEHSGVEVWTVRPATLSQAVWSHHVDDHGHAETQLVLPGRPAVGSHQVRAVFNRIQHLPVPGFLYGSAQDRDYAAAEFQALMQSWLASLGARVVHSLLKQALLSPQLPLLRWADAAASCGLPVAQRDAGMPALEWDATVLVSGAQTTGVLAGRFGSACRVASQALGFSVLEFRFVRRAKAPADTLATSFELVGVSPYPALTDLEDIDAVAACICDVVRSHTPAELERDGVA
jgi:hypothetical protein